MNISVIIPTYKNKQLLLNNLKKNYPFFKDLKIIIVNDDPEESLKKDLSSFKNIDLIEHKNNVGFSISVNDGVNKTGNDCDLIMLLNNDVVLLDDSYKKAVGYFSANPLLFAVSFSQKEKDGKMVGKNRLFWYKGFVSHAKRNKLLFGTSAWAEGGACIIDKKKFVALSGFDPLYSPFYWEDIDLSYRAWKSGFEVLFDPKIIVEHQHETTIGKYFDIAYRNQFLFIWKNITDVFLLFQHIVMLPIYFLKLLTKREFSFFYGFFSALKYLPKIKRIQYTISDKTVFRKLNHE